MWLGGIILKGNKRLLPLLISCFFLFSINISGSGVAKMLASVPQKISASMITSSEIDLKWNAAKGAAGYKIYRGSPNDSKYVQVGKTSGTSFKNLKLKQGTSYWYYVTSYNAYGASGASKHIRAVTKEFAPKPPVKLVLGFATSYYDGDVSSNNSMTGNVSSINQIATDTFTTDGTGKLSGTVPIDQISYANKNNIKSLAMISNNFDGSTAKDLLENALNRKCLINNILLSLIKNNYKGVNIDLEGVYPSDRGFFSIFVKELYTSLHPLGYAVSVSVPAETMDNPENSWNGAYDYKEISKYADTIAIMTYDEHSPGGKPGPIASIDWVKSVVGYAAGIIPKNKILLGIAAYGYDWSASETKAYGISGINDLISKYKAKVIWATASKSSYFNYTDNKGIIHTVWFENSTSLEYKLDIVNNSNLAGIALWRLGLEDSSYWTAIKSKLYK